MQEAEIEEGRTRGKRQETRDKGQETRGKGQEARDKGQGARDKSIQYTVFGIQGEIGEGMSSDKCQIKWQLNFFSDSKLLRALD
jgi:hypothetical protein